MKKNRNFLDFVPVREEKHRWEEKEDGTVTVHVVHDGLFDKIAQRFFHRPALTHLSLDETGSFVWKSIDGKRTVYNIAGLLKEQYSEKAEPLYERLAQYIMILKNNELIRLEKH